jgi:broad specificity phosphatase PhoE
MRWLEVRRHSVTKKGPAAGHGSVLSAPGVTMARAVGADLGSISYVVTSAEPRAIETAIAMGFAVDDTVDLPSGYVPGEVGHHDQWDWPEPYVQYAELLERSAGLAAVASAHQTVWVSAASAVPDGSAALVVCHGGAIEPSLVACLPHANYSSWGAPFGHCDGARLGFHDGRFVSIRFRRAAP